MNPFQWGKEENADFSKAIQCAKEGNADFFKAAESDLIWDSRDEIGNSVLHVAVKEGHLNCCQVIYRRCPNLLYVSNLMEFTPLHVAALNNRAEITKFLLYARAKAAAQKKGAAEDIEMGRMEEENVTADSTLLRMVTVNGRTALHTAADCGYVEVAKILIGADPSNHLLLMVDEDNRTALHYAVERGSVELAKLLIEADPKNDLLMMKDHAGRTALHFASNVQMAKLLISRAGPRSGELLRPDREGRQAMQKEWIFDLLLDTSLHIDWTPILSRQITSDFWRIFIEKEMHINKVTQGLLDIVEDKDSFDALANKIQNWAECLECVSSDGQNILHLAAKFGAEDVVKHILGRTDIDEKLLNMQDTQGNTPLHIAATSAGRSSIILSLLYDQRVDKFLLNKQGKSALDAINFEYDKRRAGVYGLTQRVDEKDLKDRSDFDLVVGALIATVSFAAGITVPGGYFSDGPNQGNAVLHNKGSFQAFVISNTIALMLSLSAVFSHFCTRRFIKEDSIIYQLKVASYCSLGAIFAMMIAFITGSYSVLAVSDWLDITVCVICCCFFGIAFPAMRRMVREQRHMRESHSARHCWGFSI